MEISVCCDIMHSTKTIKGEKFFMVITLVTDQFYQNNHGTNVSAQRLHDGLISRGHTVRVVTVDKGNNTPYSLKERSFGKAITHLINSQGFQFAKPDKEVLRKAIEGSDVVHVYTPFKLGYTTIKLCREMNVPCTAACHITPENITSSIYLEKFPPANNYLWRSFKNTTYRYVKHIHCPSLMVAQRLKEREFNSNLHVISNGYNEMFKMKKEEKPVIVKDKIVLSFIGRFSREKRYDLIIKAVNESKYRNKIQLIFAGKGPTKKHVMKTAKILPVYPMFCFFSREQVVSLLNFSDLYVHPAIIEVEGMSCIESIACGCVPIVSNSPKSATSQFAVHENSIFDYKSYKDLAAKIDWWIEHPEECAEQKKKLVQHAERFTIEHSMDYYINMFEAAVKDWDKDYDGKNKKKAIPSNIINNYAK